MFRLGRCAPRRHDCGDDPKLLKRVEFEIAEPVTTTKSRGENNAWISSRRKIPGASASKGGSYVESQHAIVHHATSA